MRQRRWLSAAGLSFLWLCGCAVGPNYPAPTPEVPASFTSAGTSATPASAPPPTPAARVAELGGWWHALGDPQLDALVEDALKGNPGLDIALVRLQEARTFEVALTGTALPRLDVGAGGGRGTGSDLSRGRAPGALTSADHSVPAASRITQVAGFDAAWDIDLFGGLRREIEAARYDAQAAAAARDAVQVAVIADVVRSYLDLRGLQMAAAVLRANLRAAQSLIGFVQQRYDHGITNELDLTLARRQLAAVAAQVAPLNAQIDATRYAIATLLGRYPQDIDAQLARPGVMPLLPERIAPGLPLELLRRRPDIREAEWDLAGATARVGVATASLFPQLSVSGAAGVQGQGLGYSQGSSQRIWSLGYSVIFPLLDFGVLDALADIADLKAREKLLTYKQTVLHAVQDVDGSLAAFAAQQERLRNLGEAVLAAQRATVLATERYDRGLTDFLNVADAQRQEYELEGEYAYAQMNLAQTYVSVYRALGGGWEQYAGPPDVRTPQPAVLAMFRRMANSAAAP
jgi:NodT family efflux transporter outer membrane factor (OMF) lipoprotein